MKTYKRYKAIVTKKSFNKDGSLNAENIDLEMPLKKFPIVRLHEEEAETLNAQSITTKIVYVEQEEKEEVDRAELFAKAKVLFENGDIEKMPAKNISDDKLIELTTKPE